MPMGVCAFESATAMVGGGVPQFCSPQRMFPSPRIFHPQVFSVTQVCSVAKYFSPEKGRNRKKDGTENGWGQGKKLGCERVRTEKGTEMETGWRQCWGQKKGRTK